MHFDVQTLTAVIFFVVLSIFVYLKKDKLQTQGKFPYFYFSMYRDQWGLSSMDSLGKKWNKTIKFLGYLGIVAGFLGMIFICFALADNIYKLTTKPETAPGVGLVLPFKIKGVFFVPFWYWIISIFVVALIHEFAHGVVARAHKLKVKSSGFAFVGTSYLLAGLVTIAFVGYAKMKENNFDLASLLSFNPLVNGYDFWISIGLFFIIFALIKNFPFPVIPAAFVEPDEKVLRKRPHAEQLSVFAAGPFSNVLLAAAVFGLLFLIAPLTDDLVELDGVEITGFITDKDYPVRESGIVVGEIVREVDGFPIESRGNFSAALLKRKPDDVAHIQTDKGSYDIKLAQNPSNASMPYLGVMVAQHTKINPAVEQRLGVFLPEAFIWFIGLLTWLFILNLGIGLFNLVPIGPLDGGRMMQLVTHRFWGEEKGNKVWYYVSMVFLGLVLINIIFAFL